MSRPRCRLVTGSVRRRSVALTVRTDLRRPQRKAPQKERADVLASPALWLRQGDISVLHLSAREALGAEAVVSPCGSRWKWSVPGAACVGTASSLGRARRAAVAEAVRRLAPAGRDAAVRRLSFFA